MPHATPRIIREEHRALTAMLRSIQLLLTQARREGTPPDFAALRAMLFYIDEFPLPLAEQVLTAQDWADLDEAFQANRDPLTGHTPEIDFQALFTLIVNRVPAPIGVGDATSGRGPAAGFFTGLGAWCPLYRALGMSTTSR